MADETVIIPRSVEQVRQFLVDALDLRGEEPPGGVRETRLEVEGGRSLQWLTPGGDIARMPYRKLRPEATELHHPQTHRGHDQDHLQAAWKSLLKLGQAETAIAALAVKSKSPRKSERQKLVAQLYLQEGLGAEEIARRLPWGKRTVERDLQEIRQALASQRPP